ncbi:Uncharacterised protein [Collinsella intestinalis]|nr:Uncharacterised protein [Collinsella intestinalis]
MRFRTVLVAGSGNFSNLDEHVLVHTEAAVGVLVQAETGDDVILVGNGTFVRTTGDFEEHTAVVNFPLANLELPALD